MHPRSESDFCLSLRGCIIYWPLAITVSFALPVPFMLGMEYNRKSLLKHVSPNPTGANLA